MDNYGIVGNPVKHSLSPLIHRQFAEQFNQTIAYETILVPLDGLAAALNQFQAAGGKGLNVTLPFKQKVFDFVDICSEPAKLAGAINTLTFHLDGSLSGDNTDGIGLVRDIMLNHQFSLRDKRILILGAGGAVRGVLQPILQQNPTQVIIANRTENKAIELAQHFAKWGNVLAAPFAELLEFKFDLVINGTSVSLQNESLPLPNQILQKNAFCYDMVYGKGSTAFLKWGENNGAAKCVDGLGMLIEQAAESFFLWRQQRPNTEPVFLTMSNGEKSGGSERF